MPRVKIVVLIVELTPLPPKGEAGEGGETIHLSGGFECVRETGTV